MFTRSFLGNQFQPSAFGVSPFAGAGGITPFPTQMGQMGGYNPLLPFLTPQVSGIGTFGGYNPALPQIGNYGFNPYLAALAGLHPAINLAGPSVNPFINSLIAAQLAGINPNPVSQIWGGAFGQQSNHAFGQQSNPWLVNPLFQQAGGETGYFGQAPFGQSLTGGFPTQATNYYQSSPYMAQDPITAALLAQQLNPLAQQRLPIRPLSGQQQVDPFQAGLFGLTGLPVGQMVDPYSALAQAQLLSQYATNPVQQTARPHTLGNWGGSPYSVGQTQ